MGLLVADIPQELNIKVMLVIGDDVADAEEYQTSNGNAQLLQGLATGAFLQGLSHFQVAPG
jgi:hypothetical protein